MPLPGHATVDDYLQVQTPEARAVLEQVRAILHSAMPGATEVISYQIPCLRFKRTHGLYFAAHSEHYAVYPVTPRIREALGSAIEPFLSGRATLRFAYDAPVPEALIKRVAMARRAEITDAAARKKKKR